MWMSQEHADGIAPVRELKITRLSSHLELMGFALSHANIVVPQYR